MLADRTGSFDLPFYLAGAMFFCCSGLLLVYPVRQYLHRKDNRNVKAVRSSLSGVDNVAVDMDNN